MCRGGERERTVVRMILKRIIHIFHIIVVCTGNNNNNNSAAITVVVVGILAVRPARARPPTPTPPTPFRHATAAMTPECLPNAINNRDVVVPLIRSLRRAPPEQCRWTEFDSSLLRLLIITRNRFIFSFFLFFLFFFFFVPEKLGRSVLREYEITLLYYTVNIIMWSLPNVWLKRTRGIYHEIVDDISINYGFFFFCRCCARRRGVFVKTTL